MIKENKIVLVPIAILLLFAVIMGVIFVQEKNKQDVREKKPQNFSIVDEFYSPLGVVTVIKDTKRQNMCYVYRNYISCVPGESD